MTYEQFEQFAGAWESIATTIALIVGAIWAYQRFIRQREAHPYVSFSVDINLVGRQGGYWITELQAWIENKGKVRHEITDFQFDLFALRPSDEVGLNPEIGNQVFFPHEVAKGSWIPKTWRSTFIDPGVKTHYSHMVRVPEDVSFIIMHAWFAYPGTNDSHSAEKTIAIPQSTPAA